MQVDPEGMDHMVTFQLEVMESFFETRDYYPQDVT